MMFLFNLVKDVQAIPDIQIAFTHTQFKQERQYKDGASLYQKSHIIDWEHASKKTTQLYDSWAGLRKLKGHSSEPSTLPT